MDKFSKEKRSEIMKAVKMKDSKIEQDLRKKLWNSGIKFRKNVTSLYGKPDISIKNKKIVIFIDSCFWHGCEKHLRIPQDRKEYWEEKIKGNIARDKEVTSYYKLRNWTIIRLWEHDLKNDKVINELIESIQMKKKREKGFDKYEASFSRKLSNSEKARGYIYISFEKKARDILGDNFKVIFKGKEYTKNLDKSGRITLSKYLTKNLDTISIKIESRKIFLS